MMIHWDKLKKLKWRYIAYIVLVVLFVFLYKSCRDINAFCSYTDKIEKIRSLPEDRLAKLYKDMKTLYDSSDDSVAGYYWANTEPNLPPEFSDLDISVIKPKEAVIIIGGCFDDKAFLNFRGLDSSNDTFSNPEIYMHWGDLCKECNQVIWSKE